MKDFIVRGYAIAPGAVLVAGVYRATVGTRRWIGEVFVDHQGETNRLAANGGHMTAEDAFGWAKSELDRIEALRKTHYEGNKP